MWSETSESLWDLTSTEELWSSNFKLTDINHQVNNKTVYLFNVANDESIFILMGVFEVSEAYLAHINQEGELAYKVNRLNMTFSFEAQKIETDTAGYVYNAGVSPDGNLTIGIYDSTRFVPNFHLSDIQLIGVFVVGVIMFDSVLIIILKKKV